MLGRAKQKMKEKLGKSSGTEEPPEFMQLLDDLKVAHQCVDKTHKLLRSIFASEENDSVPPHDNFNVVFLKPALTLRKKYNTARLDMDAKNEAIVSAKPEKKEQAKQAAHEAKNAYENAKNVLTQVIDGINEQKDSVFQDTVRKSIAIVTRIDPGWEGYEPAQNKRISMETSDLTSALSQEQLELVHLMQGQNGVEIADRTWHLKKYPQCFVASELVTWMTGQGYAKDKAEAIAKAEKFRQLQVFCHASESKVFDDGFLFYRFNETFAPAMHLRQTSDAPRPTAHLEDEDDSGDVIEIDDSDAIHCGHLLLFCPQMETKSISQSSSKTGFFKNTSGPSGENTWTPFYFVAKEGILTWCAASKTGKILGELDLNNVTMSNDCMDLDHRQAFILRDDESEMVYHLDPVEEEDREQWIPSLCLAIPTKLFGVPLALAAERSDPQQLVPAPLKVATEWLNIHGLREEGLYRIPGSKDEVEKWIRLFDKGSEVIIPEQYSGSNLASLIVQYLRRLPASLMTDEYSAVFQTVADDESKSENNRLQIMKKLLTKIPPTNYETLKVLCYHLNQVSMYAEENQMDAGKLAMCVYTTCARPLQMLIFNYAYLFDDE